MSLINEALKKAQQLRADESASNAAPAEPREPGATVVARRSPRSARAVALITLASGMTLLGTALLAYHFFALPASTVVMGPASLRPKPAPATPTVPPISPATEQKLASEGTSPPLAPAAPVAVAQPPVATPPPEKTASGRSHTSPSSSVAPTDSSTGASSQPGAAATPSATAMTLPAGPTNEPAPRKTSEQAQAFLDGMRVMGIRAAGEDSRVLLNGRHYRINDVVDRALGLRLVKVESNCLHFEDPNGAVYLKFF